MTLSLITLPCLKDNYAYLVHNRASGETALIDVPEAPPILEALALRGWRLTDVVLTHHHWDHVDGLPGLLAALPDRPRIIGAAADAHRLPPLDLAVAEGDALTLCGESAQVFDVSGHTLGHIALHLPGPALAFTADSLMAMGCGRLFEGSPATMWQSLGKLAALPDATLVCSGHEYTQSNMRFALSLEPAHPALISRSVAIEAARSQGLPTVPSTLGQERATNPFLRAGDPDLKAAVGMTGAPDAEVFAEIRARKDKF